MGSQLAQGAGEGTEAAEWGKEARGLIACLPVPFPAFISLILSLMGACQECGLWEGL